MFLLVRFEKLKGVEAKNISELLIALHHRRRYRYENTGVKLALFPVRQKLVLMLVNKVAEIFLHPLIFSLRIAVVLSSFSTFFGGIFSFHLRCLQQRFSHFAKGSTRPRTDEVQLLRWLASYRFPHLICNFVFGSTHVKKFVQTFRPRQSVHPLSIHCVQGLWMIVAGAESLDLHTVLSLYEFDVLVTVLTLQTNNWKTFSLTCWIDGHRVEVGHLARVVMFVGF